MNQIFRPGWLLMVALLAGCAAPRPDAGRPVASRERAPTNSLLEQQFVFNVLVHLYRWHFDQSYVLEPAKHATIEVWTRRLHPKLDEDDRSEYAEMWIPSVNMLVGLKRAEYRVPEMKLEIADQGFKINSVNRQINPPASKSSYEVGRFEREAVRDYLFATRTNRLVASEAVRTKARQLMAAYLKKEHPEPFTEEQVLYRSQLSPVCNEVWVFWENGRRVRLFSGDMDLTHPKFWESSPLRLDVIELDKDVVTSTKEVPGSNSFVTKDWVGRLLFNCLVLGDKMVIPAAEVNRMRSAGQ
jgi:hypothetical protein